jgi:hypothetical protein
MGEELDDEEVIVRPTHPACKAIVPQPSVGVGLTIVFDDVAQRPEAFWKACMTHIAYKCFWP